MLHFPILFGIPGDLIVEGQVFVNGQALGASRQAVAAGGAGGGGDGPDPGGGIFQLGFFGFRQRNLRCQIFLDLGDGIHAAEDRFHAGKARCEADGPACGISGESQLHRGRGQTPALHGLHDQDGLANISDVNFDDYRCVDAFEDSRIPERAAKALAQNPVPLVAETTICSDNYVDPVWTSHTSLYFPKTRNLYNYVRVPEEGTEGSLNYPAGELLFGWQEVLEYEWDERGLPIIWIFYHFDNKADRFGVDIIYTDEKMSWREWCESEFNINGWTYVDEGDGWVVPPFFDYVIQDAGEDVPLDADKVGFHPGLRLNGEKCMLYYIDILSLSEARELGYPG